MTTPVREKIHRLPPEAYRGNVIVAFTVNTANHARYFDDPAYVALAVSALTEAFANHHGHVGVYVFMPDHLHLIVSGTDIPGSRDLSSRATTDNHISSSREPLGRVPPSATNTQRDLNDRGYGKNLHGSCNPLGCATTDNYISGSREPLGRVPPSDLLAMMKEFKQKTTFRLRQAGKPFGWQKDFYDHIVRANEDYGAQVRYLLRNPVRRRLCADWRDWPNKGVLGQTWEQLTSAIATL